jgi:hypothetical protein
LTIFVFTDHHYLIKQGGKTDMKRSIRARALAVTAAIVAMAAVSTLSTGCDVDAEFAGVYNVYDIPVRNSDWKIESSAAGVVTYAYVDLRVPELNGNVINRAVCTTYYQYRDGNELVEVPLPHTVYNLETEVNSEYRWQYTIEAEYSYGNLRLKLSTSDFNAFKPDDTLYFRLAIVR